MNSNSYNKAILGIITVVGILVLVLFGLVPSGIGTDIDDLDVQINDGMKHNIGEDETVYIGDGDKITFVKNNTDVTSDVSLKSVENSPKVSIDEDMTVSVDDSLCNIEYRRAVLSARAIPQETDVVSSNYTVSYGFQDRIVEFKCSPLLAPY